jgi:hypothetical protein
VYKGFDCLEERKMKPRYPLMPYYGKFTKYEDVPISFPSQRETRHPGL